MICSNNLITYDMDCNTIVNDINFDDNYVYIYVLQLNRSNEIITQVAKKENVEDQVVFDIGQDGFYTLITVKIPLDSSKEYYYKNGKIYHIHEEADLAVLLELNPEVSGLIVEPTYYFQTCRLRKCYINICQQIFDQVNSVECNKPLVDQNLIYKRDLLLSAIHIIEFMVEKEQYKEAERLLDSSRPCNCGCL